MNRRDNNYQGRGKYYHAGWAAFDPAIAEAGEKKEEGGRELRH